ncbi:tetratricopeptide repeat protein [bacterium]|nr:tetratricopeptide repeat protein [bacterium]MBP5590737.1 tetratricopeptide repeat protein [bacterium]
MNKIKILSLIFILFQLFAACSSADNKTISDERKSDGHYQLGLAALNQGDYIKAKREIMLAIEAAPNLPQYYNTLGLVFMIEHDDKKAEENFRQALKIDKKFTDARNNLGALYLEQKQFDKALEEFQAVLSDTMYPRPHYAETNIGIVYRMQKKYDLAKQHFEAALKMRGTYFEPYKQMGLMYDEQDMHELAAENYKKAIEYFPFCVEALYRGALKMYMLKNEELGEKYLRSCLEVQAINTKEVSIPFLNECVDLAKKLGVTAEIERKKPEKKQQIESVN